MAKKKPKRAFTFRCSEIQLDALNELLISGGIIRPKDFHDLTKTDWLNLGLSALLRRYLKREISENQVDSIDSVDEVYRLFVMWSRAERGIKGYGFSTKSKKTRFVFGPSKEKL